MEHGLDCTPGSSSTLLHCLTSISAHSSCSDLQFTAHIPPAALQIPDVRPTVALVIAKVAAIEIPHAEWPELVRELLSGAAGGNPSFQLSSLQALGYLCEELGSMDGDYLQQEEVNGILTAVVQGMRKEETNRDVRLAATNAFNNALEFAETNFENEMERNYMMQMVCEGTLADDQRIRQASWECLVRVASGYYETLPAYINDIFSLTQRALAHDVEEVTLQALEVWCTICEEEIERNMVRGAPGGGHSFIFFWGVLEGRC